MDGTVVQFPRIGETITNSLHRYYCAGVVDSVREYSSRCMVVAAQQMNLPFGSAMQSVADCVESGQDLCGRTVSVFIPRAPGALLVTSFWERTGDEFLDDLVHSHEEAHAFYAIGGPRAVETYLRRHGVLVIMDGTPNVVMAAKDVRETIAHLISFQCLHEQYDDVEAWFEDTPAARPALDIYRRSKREPTHFLAVLNGNA